MFSHCIFNLEDMVLDCIDATLRERGWRVDSLIYDGVSVWRRTTPCLRASAPRPHRAALSPKPHNTLHACFTPAQLHVRHRDNANLEAALRAAELAVKMKLGYEVALTEKPLYNPDSVIPAGALDAAGAEAGTADAAADHAVVEQALGCADGED